ncbi:MAG: ABC transporter ATP-binding protein [Legionellales bacterium]|nr:ABC transporter ATP-binding protein [Legionellales bacterium]
MSTLIQMIEGEKQIGHKRLFEQASFIIREGEHVGVIGPNGAGKTTLFKTLVGESSLDTGELVFAQKLKIGYLDQESTWAEDITAEDYLEAHCQMPIWELKSLGLSLGLQESHFSSTLQSLSGGYRMRMKLLYMIGQEPNCMLLDEPTNFLDLESIIVLESFLKQTKSAFLVISHDRAFLNRITNVTLEVMGGKIRRHPGNVEAWLEYKAQEEELLDKTIKNEQAKKAELEAFVNRFKAKASKAKQAQSRVKQLEKMPTTVKNASQLRANIRIPKPIHTGKETLHIEKAVLGYPTKTVLSGVDFRLMKGDHLAVVGFNGAGKTTLLKSLANQLPLKEGSIKIGLNVAFGYYAQHVPEQLPLDSTVFEALASAAHPEVSEQEIKDIAGSLLFKGEDVHKTIGVLSGGEKSRVAIGQILLKKAPCLLLDEPTNHLDFDTVESLTDALRSYGGTIVVVSHDRHFVSRIASKILEIKDGQAHFYPGTYEEYCWSVEKGMLSGRQEPSDNGRNKKQGQTAKSTSGPTMSLGKLSKAIKDEEKRINRLGNELKRIELNLQTASSDESAKLSQQYSDVKRELEGAEATWLTMQEQLEAARK